MSKQFIIDTLNFIRNAGVHRGRILPAELERLRTFLSDHSGKIAYSINGVLDEKGRSTLKVTINGVIALCCQRCLGKLEHDLNIKTDLLIAKNEDELAYYDEDSSVDAILASHEMDALILIEDEIILSLPISPRHREDECSIGNVANNVPESTKLMEQHSLESLKNKLTKA